MTSAGGRRGGSREAGVALLLAVWILALLAVIAQELIASGRVRLFTELNRRDDLSGLALAVAGYHEALAALEQVTGLSRKDDKLLFHFKGSTDGEPAFREDVPLGDGKFSWHVEDEDGRVNINDPNMKRARLVDLLEQCGMEPGVERDAIADSILDWLDGDSSHKPNGAEEDYYQDLEEPYSCKDGIFDVVEELLLVKGLRDKDKQWVYYGGERDGKKYPGLRKVVTTFGRSIMELNLATAPEEVLKALKKVRQTSPVDSLNFTIVATGRPDGSSPPRSLRAVVRRDPARKPPFVLLYWNEMYRND